MQVYGCFQVIIEILPETSGVSDILLQETATNEEIAFTEAIVENVQKNQHLNESPCLVEDIKKLSPYPQTIWT